MNTKSKGYLDRLKEKYRQFNDQDSLRALEEIESTNEDIRLLKIYREHPKTQELIKDCLRRYKVELSKLSKKRDMSEAERQMSFISMDWAMWFLDSVGVDPEIAESQVDEMVMEYAMKAGISTE